MTLPTEKKRRIVPMERLKERKSMEKPEKPKAKKPGMGSNKRGRRISDHTAAEKCHAVLSVWTEKRRLGEVCRELGVAWSSLNQWQDRAMEGMLMALQPRVVVDKDVALNPRLVALLERKIKGGVIKGLDRRLAKLQGSPVVKPGEMREAAAEKKS